MSSKAEQEFMKLNVEIRLLEENAKAIKSRVNMVDTLMADLTMANMTLEGLEQADSKSNLLVPIGGNSYIKGELQPLDKVIVAMGSGVCFEKTVEEAKEVFNSRLDGLKKTRESLSQSLGQVVQKISEDKEQLEELASELRKENPPRNV